ncbi:MAG TPA: hypothetical protein VH877_01635 [Polyangia bacterium]|jgi:uncharacterized tellurite resistance protein B-like protein|nr:hypothetical protein [Polyangia bacterium]
MARTGSKRGATVGRVANARPQGRRQAEPTLAEEIEASGETPVDEREAAERADREDYAFLAREFLTWLVYHAEEEGGTFAGTKEVPAFVIQFGGRLVLRTLVGAVTEVALKGPSPVGSADLRYAVAGGLSVKEADLVLEQDERVWTFALSAEYFDLKRVKLPEVLDKEEAEQAERDDAQRADERLLLLGTLDEALRAAFAHFLELRSRPAWSKSIVPALRAWLEDGT